MDHEVPWFATVFVSIFFCCARARQSAVLSILNSFRKKSCLFPNLVLQDLSPSSIMFHGFSLWKGARIISILFYLSKSNSNPSIHPLEDLPSVSKTHHPCMCFWKVLHPDRIRKAQGRDPGSGEWNDAMREVSRKHRYQEFVYRVFTVLNPDVNQLTLTFDCK